MARHTKLKGFITCLWVLLKKENVLHENSMTMMYTKEPIHIFVYDFLIYKSQLSIYVLDLLYSLFNGKLFNRKCEDHVFNQPFLVIYLDNVVLTIYRD